jgi:hypothetical protein
VRRCARCPAGVRCRLGPSKRGAGRVIPRSHDRDTRHPRGRRIPPVPRADPPSRHRGRHTRAAPLGMAMVEDPASEASPDTPTSSSSFRRRNAKNRYSTSRRALSCGRRHRPVHGHRALRSSSRLCGASLLPLERRLISLNSTTPQPACQDAPVPDQERNSGRSRTSTPPAPFDHFSLPSKPQNEIVVSPSSLPTTSPVNPGDKLAGFWSSPPAMAPEDYIASISVIPVSFP